MILDALVLDGLTQDIIIGAVHISRWNLHQVNAALMDRFAASRPPDESRPQPVGLAAILPIINDLDEDSFGDLAAYPVVNPTIPDGDSSYGGPSDLQQRMQELVAKFDDIFASKVGNSAARVPPMTLELEENAVMSKALQLPVRSQCREHNEALQEQLAELQAVGVIEAVNTQYFSQVLLVRKADKSLRFCVDYRHINKITKSQPFPLPNIPLLLQSLQGNKYFSVIDLTAGYHQCPLDADAQAFSAFKTAQGIFMFTRVPFGFKQAPGYFQKIMQDLVLHGLVGKICLVYIDDIIVWGKTDEEILTNTQIVFERLRKFELKIKKSKCRLGVTTVQYVGHIVSETGIRMSDERKEAVLRMQQPTTVTDLRRFLGTTNYFRAFIQNYAQITAPLYALDCHGPKAKKHPVTWTTEADDAFVSTRQAIADASTLTYLKDEGEVRLYTDASDFAIGAHLVQVDEEGVEHTVSFYSKRLTAVEQRWNTSEKEMYAVIMAVKKLHTFIGGRPFIVMTDHRNLSFWQTPSASPKVERWRQLLSVYDITWRVIPGSENVMADALSRLLAMYATTAQPTLLPVIATMSTTEPAAKKQRARQHKSSEPPINLACVHGDAEGHFKLDKTLEKLKARGITWPGMARHVADFIRSCPVCQRSSTAPSHSHGATFTLKAARPNELVAMDTVGPLDVDTYGFAYVLVFVDHMTSFVRAYPLFSTEAKECAKRLVEYMCREGIPKNLHSDRGTQFVNAVIAETTRFFRVQQSFSTAYSHEENGVVERTIKDLRNQLLAYLLDSKGTLSNWSDAIPMVERILNTKVCSYTGVTPAAMKFGHANALEVGVFADTPPEGDISSSDYLAQIKWFQELVIGNLPAPTASTSSAATKFEEGDLILVDRVVRLKKQVDEPLRDGPFLVLRQSGDRVSYENYQTSKVSTVHVSRCRKYHPRGDPWVELRAAMAAAGSYEVEEILSHQKIRTSYKFIVKYLGYDPPEEDSSKNLSLRATQAFRRYADKNPELRHLVLGE